MRPVKHLRLSIFCLSSAIVACVCMLIGGCGGGFSDGGLGTTSALSAWSMPSPTGGFIPNIIFISTSSSDVLAAGDFGSGIFRTANAGASWAPVGNSFPTNFTAYALVSDSSGRIYAADYYGRGMAYSINKGASWTTRQAGLPSSGAGAVNELAVNPVVVSNLAAASNSGLYLTTDFGVTFTKSTLITGLIGAVAYSASGGLYAGSSTGAIYYSADNGASWATIGTLSSAIAKISISTFAVYVATNTGDLVSYSLPTNALSATLNSSTTGIITGSKIALAVKSTGAGLSSDIIYFGTSRHSTAATSRWGLYKSTTGGISWSQMAGNISGSSIFSIAIDPNSNSNVMVGSASADGVFYSTDAGTNWANKNSGLYAHTSSAFAEDPTGTGSMIFSSSIGSGLGKSYFSENSGATWTSFSEVVANDGVAAFYVNPTNANKILAGTFSSGLYSSATSIYGPWTQIITQSIGIDHILRDTVDSTKIYAFGVSSATALYYSGDSGASFTSRGIVAYNFASHPSHAGEGIVASIGDVYASADSFSTQAALGLSTYASQEQNYFTAVAYQPNNASVVLVGGASGGLFKTTNYNVAGLGVSWTQIAGTGISSVAIKDIIIVANSTGSTYYVVTDGSATNYGSSATPGVFRSKDDGVSWVKISSTLTINNSFLSFVPSVGSPTSQFFGRRWGGGISKLTDN